MFHSIYTITLVVITISILLPSIILKKSPYKVISVAITKILTDKKKLLHFSALFAILYANKVEQKIGESLLSEDYTHYIRGFEGNIVYYIQQLFANDTLTFLLTFFYIIVFPSLMISSIVIYLNKDDQKSFYNFVYALMLNYGIAIPFFLFFPVYEVWFYDHSVHFLIPSVYPNFELEYRPLSGINNNFPSLHTSISMTMAFIAMRSKSINFGKIAFISAIIIVFSTLYLGIHWLSDMAAGTLLAILASQTGLILSERTVGAEGQLYVKNN